MSANIKKVFRFLVKEALAKAERENNEWMILLIRGMNPKKLTNAQAELLNNFLEIPKGTMLNIQGKEAKYE